MRLLIVTQTVDQKDPVLGFVHRWIEEFSKYFEHIVVIGNASGTYELPQNVEVYSLGKYPAVPGVSPSRDPLERVVRSLRYLWLIVSLRKKYDAVLVHMTPEHLVLGGPVFKLFNKKASLWYNHTTESPWLALSAKFAQNIFHTSPYAAPTRFSQAKRMPAGIDTELFKPSGVKKIPQSIYFQGRVAPAKKVHILLEAFAELYKKGVANKLTIVGPEDTSYTEPLKKKYSDLIKNNVVTFLGPREYILTPELYESHNVSVNLTDRGNYDKTVLESMACGTPCVVSSDAFSDLIPKERIFVEGSAQSLARILEKFMKLPEAEQNSLSKQCRETVLPQSLPRLAKKIQEQLSHS